MHLHAKIHRPAAPPHTHGRYASPPLHTHTHNVGQPSGQPHRTHMHASTHPDHTHMYMIVYACTHTRTTHTHVTHAHAHAHRTHTHTHTQMHTHTHRCTQAPKVLFELPTASSRLRVVISCEGAPVRAQVDASGSNCLLAKSAEILVDTAWLGDPSMIFNERSPARREGGGLKPGYSP